MIALSMLDYFSKSYENIHDVTFHICLRLNYYGVWLHCRHVATVLQALALDA